MKRVDFSVALTISHSPQMMQVSYGLSSDMMHFSRCINMSFRLAQRMLNSSVNYGACSVLDSLCIPIALPQHPPQPEHPAPGCAASESYNDLLYSHSLFLSVVSQPELMDDLMNLLILQTLSAQVAETTQTLAHLQDQLFSPSQQDPSPSQPDQAARSPSSTPLEPIVRDAPILLYLVPILIHYLGFG